MTSYEIETEVEHADDRMFAKRAQISAQKVVHTAHQRFRDTRPNSSSMTHPPMTSPSARTQRGDHQYKVEIDAISRKIIGLSVEQSQIGNEHNEELDSNDESPNMKHD